MRGNFTANDGHVNVVYVNGAARSLLHCLEGLRISLDLVLEQGLLAILHGNFPLVEAQAAQVVR